MQNSSPIFGVSFSIKQCRNLQLNPHAVLDWLIEEGGFRRFRLMSYWDEHEQQPGQYDFRELDWQMDRVAQIGGQVSLCLGARQPRWPENHWPNWAWSASKAQRTAALLAYNQKVIERYCSHPALASYQLENEALFKRFGEHSEVDIDRLIDEFELIKRLDPIHPVIMTTSHHWGIPWNDPLPDIVGFSFYHVYYSGGKYRHAGHYAWLHRARRYLVETLKHRPAFIHELQLEPWGPVAIWQMGPTEQDRSMGPDNIRRSVALARQTGLSPIDLWGGEWWYWRLHTHNDPTIWQAVKQAIGR